MTYRSQYSWWGRACLPARNLPFQQLGANGKERVTARLQGWAMAGSEGRCLEPPAGTTAILGTLVPVPFLS